jgi:hypothetical protein
MTPTASPARATQNRADDAFSGTGIDVELLPDRRVVG